MLCPRSPESPAAHCVEARGEKTKGRNRPRASGLQEKLAENGHCERRRIRHDLGQYRGETAKYLGQSPRQTSLPMAPYCGRRHNHTRRNIGIPTLTDQYAVTARQLNPYRRRFPRRPPHSGRIGSACTFLFLKPSKKAPTFQMSA